MCRPEDICHVCIQKSLYRLPLRRNEISLGFRLRGLKQKHREQTGGLKAQACGSHRWSEHQHISVTWDLLKMHNPGPCPRSPSQKLGERGLLGDSEARERLRASGPGKRRRMQARNIKYIYFYIHFEVQREKTVHRPWGGKPKGILLGAKVPAQTGLQLGLPHV